MGWFILLIFIIFVIIIVTKFSKKPKKDEKETWIIRDKQPQKAGDAYKAWITGEIPKMLKALDKPAHPVDRHFLLMGIVEQTYKLRNSDPKKRDLCERIAWQHVEKFPQIKKPLMEDLEMEVPPRVPTFQHLSTLLTEKGEYDKAVEICNKAMELGLNDGTKGGFEERIKRIRNKQKREQKGTET